MRVATDGPVTPSEVWRRYEHLDLWSSWAPQINRVETTPTTTASVDDAGSPPSAPRPTHGAGSGEHPGDAGRLAAGVSGRVVGPGGISVRFSILSVDAAAMEWTWRVERGPFAVQLIHGVEALGEGSRAWIELNPLLVPYVPFAWYALHRLVTVQQVS